MPFQLVPARETDENGITIDLPFGLIVRIGETVSESFDLEQLQEAAPFCEWGRLLTDPSDVGGRLRGDQIRLVTLCSRDELTLEGDWTFLPPEHSIGSGYNWKIGSAWLSGDPKTTAAFRIDVFDAGNLPPYEALSYTWNDYSRKTLILSASSLMITGNLANAMKLLQLQSSPRRLWIDALCINQDDEEEKTQQVQKMRDIYSGAQNVIIWLGEADEQTELAFASFERRANLLRHLSEEYMTYPLSMDEVEELDAVSNLMRRNYFDRVWIIQEVVVAKSAVVTCGSFEMDFPTLVAGARWYGYYTPHHGSDGTSIFATESNGQRMIMDGLGMWHELFKTQPKSESLRLENLLFLTRNSKATNPRDRLYALIGFTSNMSSIGISINYSISVPEVYIQATRAILANPGGVNILCAVQPDNNLSMDLPSWVPDWRSSWHIQCFGSQMFAQSPHYTYNASLGRFPSIQDVGNFKKLVIQGFPVDIIVKVLDPWVGIRGRSLRQFWFSEIQIKEIVDMQGLPHMYHYPEGPMHRAYLDTITADLLLDSGRLEMGTWDLRWPEWTRWIKARGHMDNMYAEEMPLGVRSEILYLIITQTRGRTLFVTSGGMLGLGPHTLSEKDTVVLFSGGNVPFVVRGDPGGDFNFIGECYVHGIMDGEVVPSDEEAYPPYDFHIV